MTWRPGRVDVALVLASVLPAWAALAGHLEPEARPNDLLAFALVAVVSLPMLFARRAPVPVLLLCIALIYGYYWTGYSAVGLVLPLAPAFFTVAQAGRVRLAAWIGGTGLVLSTVFRLMSDHQNEKAGLVLGYDGAISLALLAAVLALGDAVRSRRGWQAELDQRLQLAAQEREAEAQRRVADERVRIARDVHDLLGHAVAIVTLHAAVAAESLDDDPEVTRRSLETIRTVSREVLHDLGGTVGLLRGDAATSVEPAAGLADVAELVAGAASTGLDVRLAVRGEERPLPSAVGATVHRLVQESLTNVLRHARARSATVTLEHGPADLTVTVTDDGCGDHGTGGPGHGLQGMQERVALLGGRMSAGNRDGGGFAVTAVLPVTPERVGAPA
ncbi:sensor histidine kinase [Modestobacter versicolor]|uniref:histidine kinase n=1 Tax=Modestobacter versicolor TaxID=429133 RepID=A0A323V7L2_9ACTN|nr:sensor histidine kinase [Modestobacter versicolor]MBB3676323.1 signal transduction histidine kinase [Modestobacter versicolor]PZA20123.1 sensor histidine kinase [Modestobacter versicolor]